MEGCPPAVTLISYYFQFIKNAKEQVIIPPREKGFDVFESNKRYGRERIETLSIGGKTF
jgi:hypothetical protein